jgi:aspartate racemase
MTRKSLPKVGIVGGAGPMAGLLLCQKIIQICQQKYGCKQDADFPYLMLLNYPFADMLKTGSVIQQELLKMQLAECFETFASKGIQLGAIACNTLHAFLSAKTPIQVVNIIEQTEQALKNKQVKASLVLCSRTSVQSKLHQSRFNCLYPNDDWQIEIDCLIDRVLAGQESVRDVEQLICQIRNFRSELSINQEEPFGLVLGCTEFSVLNEKWPLSCYGLDGCFAVIDSSQILAEEICESVFEKQNQNTNS